VTNTSFKSTALRLPASHRESADNEDATEVRNERGHSIQVPL
jgi:hypothetical protein